jgi:hypothetical protein
MCVGSLQEPRALQLEQLWWKGGIGRDDVGSKVCEERKEGMVI